MGKVFWNSRVCGNTYETGYTAKTFSTTCSRVAAEMDARVCLSGIKTLWLPTWHELVNGQSLSLITQTVCVFVCVWESYRKSFLLISVDAFALFHLIILGYSQNDIKNNNTKTTFLKIGQTIPSQLLLKRANVLHALILTCFFFSLAWIDVTS